MNHRYLSSRTEIQGLGLCSAYTPASAVVAVAVALVEAVAGFRQVFRSMERRPQDISLSDRRSDMRMSVALRWFLMNRRRVESSHNDGSDHEIRVHGLADSLPAETAQN